MTNDLAIIINNWHLDQVYEDILIEQENVCDSEGDLIVSDDTVVDQNGDLILEKIIDEHNLDSDSRVIARIDLSINNDDDDIEIANTLLAQYDEDKDLISITVRFDNDDDGNYQGYKYLIQ